MLRMQKRVWERSRNVSLTISAIKSGPLNLVFCLCSIDVIWARALQCASAEYNNVRSKISSQQNNQ